MLCPVVKKRLDWPRPKLSLAAVETSQHSFQIVWLRDVKRLTIGRYLKTVSVAILEQVATRFIPVVPLSSGNQERSDNYDGTLGKLRQGNPLQCL